jgi:hypothetical protein
MSQYNFEAMAAACYNILLRNTVNFDRMKTDILLQISCSEIHISIVLLSIPCPKTPNSSSMRGTGLFL